MISGSNSTISMKDFFLQNLEEELQEAIRENNEKWISNVRKEIETLKKSGNTKNSMSENDYNTYILNLRFVTDSYTVNINRDGMSHIFQGDKIAEKAGYREEAPKEITETVSFFKIL